MLLERLWQEAAAARATLHAVHVAVAAGAAARAARLRPPALALMLLNNVHPQVVYSRHALLQRQPLGHLLHQRAQHGVDVGVRRPAMQLPVETAQQHVARAELRGELPEGARRHERRRRWRTRKRHVAGAAQRPQRTRHQHVGSVRGRLAQQARRVLARSQDEHRATWLGLADDHVGCDAQAFGGDDRFAFLEQPKSRAARNRQGLHTVHLQVADAVRLPQAVRQRRPLGP
mmetsp:Transcript_31579/g.94139  ORF Transcript_31579/g.94139 Transcript_31579/m.94139 type:complete len:231 (-) Transcript_31579:1170-1862(-)